MKTVHRISLVIPAALLIAACSSTDPNATYRMSFSSTTGSAGGGTHGSAALADLIITGTGGSVTMSSAQIVLSRIKLANDVNCGDEGDQNDDDAQEADSSHDNDGQEADSAHHDDQGEHEDDEDCQPVRAGPVLVAVPLDGTTKIFLDALVPAGTYTGLRAKLDAVDSDDNGAQDFLTAHPEFEGVSVKVLGVFKDSGGTDHAFTFISHMKAPIHADFDSSVTVDANSMNLTINVDVTSWFKNRSGAIIDPTNPENQRAIERSIRASLRAFEDDDHDGNDDHHGDDDHEGDGH
jgi:hypothetical protein